MIPPPLVSVCIPSYNNGDFIAFTLESILKQTYDNFEIIITDDNSTDETVSVIKRFTDSRIKLVQNETTLGVGGNWNKALSLASGKYIKLLGADDIIYSDCLRRQSEALEAPSQSGAVLAACNTDVIKADNSIVLKRRSRFKPGLAGGRNMIRTCVRRGTNLIGEPVVGLFRRDVLVRSGVFDPSNPYMIDLAFWAELLKHGDAFVDTDRLAAFRISAGSVSAKVGLKQAASFRSFVHKMRADPFYRIGAADAWMGCILSFQWCVLRNALIYLQRRPVRSKT